MSNIELMSNKELVDSIFVWLNDHTDVEMTWDEEDSFRAFLIGLLNDHES